MTDKDDVFNQCVEMLKIIFDPNSTDEDSAMARSTLVEAAAPEYMQAMLDTIYETTGGYEMEGNGECDDPECACHSGDYILQSSPVFGMTHPALTTDPRPMFQTIDDDNEELPPCDSPSLN